MNHKEVTKASYSATAAAFAANVADLAPRESIQSLIARLAPNPHVIDIGCGSGRDAKIFTELGATLTGIDFSENMLEIAKKHAPKAQFLLMDIENMQFDDGTFDAAWAACSLMQIPKQNFPKVIANIHRMLKGGGYFYLALKQGVGEGLVDDPRYEGNVQKFWSFYESDEISKILLQSHFNIVEFDLIERSHAYHTHDAFRIFCQKV